MSDSELVVMMIPDEFQVDDGLRDRVLAHLGHSGDSYDLDLPQRRLSRILGAMGVPCVDLLPRFRRSSREERLYWPFNTHWNAAGHDLAAEILDDFLSSRRQAEPGR
jgi:hypothetical protein